jgi:hypothetical protein
VLSPEKCGICFLPCLGIYGGHHVTQRHTWHCALLELGEIVSTLPHGPCSPGRPETVRGNELIWKCSDTGLRPVRHSYFAHISTKIR